MQHPPKHSDRAKRFSGEPKIGDRIEFSGDGGAVRRGEQRGAAADDRGVTRGPPRGQSALRGRRAVTLSGLWVAQPHGAAAHGGHGDGDPHAHERGLAGAAARLRGHGGKGGAEGVVRGW
eukprot:847864-Prorocentrum_minimum.AAC.1